MRIKMTGIHVSDPIKAFDFYTQTLGFKRYLFMPEMQLAIVVAPEDETGTALLLEPIGDDSVQNYHEEIFRRGLPTIVFGSKNVQKEFEDLKAKGVEFTQEPQTNEWGTSAIFKDGFGNHIQIHEDQ